MLRNEREQEILSILQNSSYITVRALSQQLFTSESSIRRALTDLEAKGTVRRSYGGVELVRSHNHVQTFRTRAHQNPAAKQAIAKKAAPLVKDGSIVFLDGSSTAFYLAIELMERSDLTVMTNNPEIINLLSQTKFTVYCSGGRLSDANRTCLVGPDAQKAFASVYAQYAFFSSNALSDSGIITDCTREEVAVRESMLQNAERKIYLCDSSKFGTTSGYRQCSLADVDMLISEGSKAHQLQQHFPALQIL